MGVIILFGYGIRMVKRTHGRYYILFYLWGNRVSSYFVHLWTFEGCLTNFWSLIILETTGDNMKHPKILVKYRNSLGGFRPVGWRYLNKGWKSMGNLLNVNQPLYMEVLKEYGEVVRENEGKIPASYMEKFHKHIGGDFNVLYDNVLTMYTPDIR